MTPLPIPSLPGYVFCEKHGVAWKDPGRCRQCPREAATPSVAATPTKPRPKAAPAGKGHEDAMAALLESHSYVVTRRGVRGEWIREYVWGAELDPPRGFRFDFAYPKGSIGVEVVGAAHLAGRAKLDRDTERAGLAAAAGWTVIPVTHAQVESGEAMDVIFAAMSARA